MSESSEPPIISGPTEPSMASRSELARFFRWFFSWRGLRRILIVFAWTATVIALFYGVEDWHGNHAWNKYRRELEARGEQLDFKSLTPKPIPDEQNFAATPLVRSWFDRGQRPEDDFVRVDQKVTRPSVAPNTPAVRRFVDLVAYQMGAEALRAGRFDRHEKLEFQSDKLDASARSNAAPAVLELLQPWEEELGELREASRRPLARYLVNYDTEDPWSILLPHLARVKSTCHRLEIRACAELAAGQSEQALLDLKLLVYVINSLQNEKFLISHLVRLAGVQLATQPLWEGLAEHRWSEAQLRELQTLFQQFDLVADAKAPLGSEQAAAVLTADLIKKRGLGFMMSLSDAGSSVTSGKTSAYLVGLLVPSGWYELEKLNYCRLFQAQLEGTYNPQTRRVSASRVKSNAVELEHALSQPLFGNLTVPFLQHRSLAGLLLPALGKVSLKSAIGQTSADQAVLACALERYRLANGRFPEKLDELTPRFLSRLPTDLISGGNYQYRRTGETGFVVYSVGWDEKDDGGIRGKRLFDEERGDWVWESAPARVSSE